MTRIGITPGALALARQLIADLPEYDQPTTAIFAIRWSVGSKDSRRVPTGETVWETIKPAGWLAEIAPWGHTPDVTLKDHAVDVEGIPVLVVHRAGTAHGKFMVSEVEGEFQVEYSEA